MSFGYARPDTVTQASALAAAGGSILAGGQSLMPLLNRGDLRPKTLVDINRLPDLDGIRFDGVVVEIGALARLEQVRTDPLVGTRLPLLAAALACVANPAIRQRGTLVGNIVHAGAGAEAVAAAPLLGGRLVCRTPAGPVERPIGTHLRGQLVTAIRIPAAPAGTRAGFYEVQRRFGHLGLVGAGVTQAPGESLRLVFSGLTDQPLVAPATAVALAAWGGEDALRAALDEDLAGRTLRSDIHAPARFRRDVAPVVACRALAAMPVTPP